MLVSIWDHDTEMRLRDKDHVKHFTIKLIHDI